MKAIPTYILNTATTILQLLSIIVTLRVTKGLRQPRPESVESGQQHMHLHQASPALPAPAACQTVDETVEKRLRNGL